MGRMLRIVVVILAVVAVVVVGYYAFFPRSSGNSGSAEERLARELTPEEQALVEGNVFTPDTLAEFNGKDGRAAYVAVNGIVYDVTDRWEDGEHHGLSAGRDETEGFLRSSHGHAVLQGLEVVGGYEEGGSESDGEVDGA